MTNAELISKLESSDACNEAVEWVAETGYDLKNAWWKCERADWLLWLSGNMIGADGWPDIKGLALAACACAKTALVYVPKNEKRPAVAIRIAERWAKGDSRITIQDIRAAACAACYAWAAASNACAARAACAALAACAAACDASDACAAASNAAAAAWAAASNASNAACNAACNAASNAAHIRMCRIIRRRLRPTGTGR